MGPLSTVPFTAIEPLADAYAALLSEEKMRTRLAHHLAHIAPERWLAMELAYLINAEKAGPTFKGWSAFPERKWVDVTLCPPTGSEIFIELKLIDRESWRSNWSEVRIDLSGRQGKPKANFAVGIMVEPVLPRAEKAKPATLERWAAHFASVPSKSGTFSPVSGATPFKLLAPSEPIRVCWPRAVANRWLEGYKADVRILWIGEADEGEQ